MVVGGDTVTITADLTSPIARDQGLRFAIREGGKTVGSGIVTDILARGKVQKRGMAIKLDQRIRIRIKSFEYRVLDQSVAEIVETVQRTGAKWARPLPVPI